MIEAFGPTAIREPMVHKSPRTFEERKQHPRWMRVLGPGLITGAADDDPSGIATYSQAGAAFGYGQLWTPTICLPLMIAVQEACARIGAVTGHGLARVTRDHYPRSVLYGAVGLVVVANTINIGADIAAVTEAIQLLVPAPNIITPTLFTLGVLALEIFVGYHKYAKFLKVLALTLLAYVATALIVAEPWDEIFRAIVIPQIQNTREYWYVIVGILGTTISPYMFFWQAAEEVEERQYAARQHIARRTISEIRADTSAGMLVSQVGSWFMMLTTATVLHANGVTTITTAADAAAALEPLVSTFPHSGELAKLIFAIGIIGMGMLGIPVLAGSASYAVSEVFKWPEGLDRKAKEARGFYGVLVASTMVGLLITFIGVDPMQALIFAAVVNGVVAVPLILLILIVSRNKKIMRRFRSRWLSTSMLATAFAVMLTCAVALLLTQLPLSP
jgi:NRAMP (natural resistance-associated macrophage protein)-like metal ion transporter